MSTYRSNRARRAGNVLVLALVFLVTMISFVALAVDVGYLYTVRNELQRSADAAAIAAAWELIDEDGPSGGQNAFAVTNDAYATAAQYAALNPIANQPPALASDDVTVGLMANPADPACPLLPADGTSMPNAVQVRVQRTSLQNGEAPLFFARVMGYDSLAIEAQATAALLNNISGFELPADGSNLEILPFALDVETWDALLAGVGSDNYRFDKASDTVSAAPDGILEVNLYPQATGSPGNRGTVDIGGSNNSTSDIARQIVHGINSGDMQALQDGGRTLELNSDGELELNGDTGISAGVKDELTGIIGLPRIIPIFGSVTEPGNNAEYTIIKFVGVRVMHVKLTGSMSSKKVILQPCNIVAKGGVLSTDGQNSNFIYSPVWLVR
ncbi:MAG: pilus assembly protein TadG-related protein [Pirellulaceae bacterium]